MMQWLEISAGLMQLHTLGMGNVSNKLKQFAKGYSRFSMGVSSENKVQLFPNLPQEVCFDLKWN